MYVPTGSIHQRELDAQIERAKANLGSEVAHVAYRIGEDSTGAASIFFRITLRDWATAEDLITEATDRVAAILFDEIRPLEDWGLRQVKTAEKIFLTLPKVKAEHVVQEYLTLLLVKKR